MKSDVVNKALGVKGKGQEEDDAEDLEEDESQDEEDEDVEESAAEEKEDESEADASDGSDAEEETPLPPPKKASHEESKRGPGRPPKSHPNPQPKAEKASETQLPQQQAGKPQTVPQPNPYVWFVQNNAQVTPVDVTVTHMKDDGMTIVLLEAVPAPATLTSPAFPDGRSALNCSIYLSKKVLDKLFAAREQ